MKEAIDKYVPKRLVKPRKFPSWFSRELRTALRKKTRFHGLYKRTWRYQKFSSFPSLAKVLLARGKYVTKDVLKIVYILIPNLSGNSLITNRTRFHNIHLFAFLVTVIFSMLHRQRTSLMSLRRILADSTYRPYIL
ncbi:unnamed protein product [Ixodes hexagonus]